MNASIKFRQILACFAIAGALGCSASKLALSGEQTSSANSSSAAEQELTSIRASLAQMHRLLQSQEDAQSKTGDQSELVNAIRELSRQVEAIDHMSEKTPWPTLLAAIHDINNQLALARTMEDEDVNNRELHTRLDNRLKEILESISQLILLSYEQTPRSGGSPTSLETLVEFFYAGATFSIILVSLLIAAGLWSRYRIDEAIRTKVNDETGRLKERLNEERQKQKELGKEIQSELIQRLKEGLYDAREDQKKLGIQTQAEITELAESKIHFLEAISKNNTASAMIYQAWYAFDVYEADVKTPQQKKASAAAQMQLELAIKITEGAFGLVKSSHASMTNTDEENRTHILRVTAVCNLCYFYADQIIRGYCIVASEAVKRQKLIKYRGLTVGWLEQLALEKHKDWADFRDNQLYAEFCLFKDRIESHPDEKQEFIDKIEEMASYRQTVLGLKDQEAIEKSQEMRNRWGKLLNTKIS